MHPVDLWNRFARARRHAAAAEGDYWLEKAQAYSRALDARWAEGKDETRDSLMQRQAVPLLVAEAPIVGTGMEYRAAKDSGVVVIAENSGTVEYVDAKCIKIKRDDNGTIDEYKLLKFKRSNQGTCIHQKAIVFAGEHIEADEVIADGPSTDNGFF